MHQTFLMFLYGGVVLFIIGDAGAAPLIYGSASGNTSVDVHIFGDPSVGDSDSASGIAPWTAQTSFSASGLNGTGSGSATVQFSPGQFCVNMRGNYSVYAAGFAGGTSATTRMSFEAVILVSEETPYSLSLQSFGVPCGISGPSLNIFGFDQDVVQSGKLSPGQYVFSGSAEGSGSGGQGTGGGFEFVLSVSSGLHCFGDANCDRTVNFSDISTVLTHWGEFYGSTGLGDANQDGTVDFADITGVLENWNVPCP